MHHSQRGKHLCLRFGHRKFSSNAKMEQRIELTRNPRVHVRRDAAPESEGTCVLYWMQRTQRGVDNPALDVAVEAANCLHKPVIVFFAPRPFPPANHRHYAFLVQGIPDITEALEKRNVGFILRRFPGHSLLKFCEEVRPALVVGDENPIRQARGWRETVARKLKIPLWTVDADVIVPSKLLEKEQHAAFIIRPRLQKHLKQFLVLSADPKAQVVWTKPRERKGYTSDIDVDEVTKGWDIDRSVEPVAQWKGGSREGLRRVKEFVQHKLPNHLQDRNHPEREGTSRLSPYLHFGHISPVTVALAVEKADVPRPVKERLSASGRHVAGAFRESGALQSNYDSFECGESGRNVLWLRMLAIHGRFSIPKRNSKTRKRTTFSGTPPRCRWSRLAGCTTTCACTGERKFWSGPSRPRLRIKSPSV
jgi:deoxyribodipyrimidine photo-lyase